MYLFLAPFLELPEEDCLEFSPTEGNTKAPLVIIIFYQQLQKLCDGHSPGSRVFDVLSLHFPFVACITPLNHILFCQILSWRKT